MKIAVIGAGYVGLTSGTAFADFGNTVWVVRRDPEKVAAMREGHVPFFEPGLEEIVCRNVKAGRLIPTTSYAEAIPSAEVIFICVGTPSKSDGSADMSQVETAARQLAPLLRGTPIIVNKSTVPMGTATFVESIVRQYAPAGVHFTMASMPEFLSQGNAVADTFHPDRIVLGANDEKTRAVLLKLHASFPGERVVCDITTAELIKYAANAFLATSISFVNEIAQLCEAFGADVTTLARALRLDRRIGQHAFMDAGVGFGGSCFTKDVAALVAMARARGVPSELLPATLRANQHARARIVRAVETLLPNPSDAAVALWGLSFKPRTDDLRDAPSLDIIRGLLEYGIKEVRVYDPVAMDKVQKFFPDVTYGHTALEAATGADCLIVVTEWDEFRECDFVKLKSVMRRPQIIDGRNIWNPSEMRALGFVYSSIGRP